MAQTIPTTEPTEIRAGDTVKWTLDLDDYPADTWTLSYTLINSSAKITITATADGTTHSVSVEPATTADYTPGIYDWTGHVTDGTDRHTVDSGTITIHPDLAAATNYDTRSHARKVLDAIESLLEGKVTIDAQSVAHNGRSLTKYGPEELLVLRDRYKAEVAREQHVEQLANGGGHPGRILTRFV